MWLFIGMGTTDGEQFTARVCTWLFRQRDAPGSRGGRPFMRKSFLCVTRWSTWSWGGLVMFADVSLLGFAWFSPLLVIGFEVIGFGGGRWQVRCHIYHIIPDYQHCSSLFILTSITWLKGCLSFSTVTLYPLPLPNPISILFSGRKSLYTAHTQVVGVMLPALYPFFTKCSGNLEENPLSAPEPSPFPITATQRARQVGTMSLVLEQGLLSQPLSEWHCGMRMRNIANSLLRASWLGCLAFLRLWVRSLMTVQ